MMETDIETKQVAVIYARVSGAKQVRDGDGLASQETRCREFASYKGYDVVRVFADDMSGKFAKRPQMDAMLSFLRKNRKQNPVVIIDDISRLARGLDAHLKLRASIANAGGLLESPSIEFGDDPDSIMVENLLATVAQHQREKNGQQTINRMRGRMMNGYWSFYPPVGYHFEKFDGHGKLLVPHEPDASYIREAFEGYASGRFASLTEVKRFFEQTDVLSKDKNGEVHLTRIQEMLDRAIYAGYIDYEPWGLSLIKGKHEPLVSLETWDAVQARRSEQTNAPARKDINQDFPLRGFVCCDDCGKPYTACWSKGRNKHYPYYICDTKGCPSYRKSIQRNKVEGGFEAMLQTMRPSRELFDLSFAIFQTIWSHHEERANSKQKAVQIELRKIDKQKNQLLDRIVEANNQSVIAAYENRIAELDRKKVKLAEQSANTHKPNGSFKEIYRTAFSFLANPCNLWGSNKLEDKRAVAKLVFADTLRFKRNEGYRTAKTSSIFNMLEDLTVEKSEMVPPAGLEPARLKAEGF